MTNRLTSCSVRLQSWPDREYTYSLVKKQAELGPDSTTKRLRGSDSFAN